MMSDASPITERCPAPPPTDTEMLVKIPELAAALGATCWFVNRQIGSHGWFYSVTLMTKYANVYGLDDSLAEAWAEAERKFLVERARYGQETRAFSVQDEEK